MSSHHQEIIGNQLCLINGDIWQDNFKPAHHYEEGGTPRLVMYPEKRKLRAKYHENTIRKAIRLLEKQTQDTPLQTIPLTQSNCYITPHVVNKKEPLRVYKPDPYSSQSCKLPALPSRSNTSRIRMSTTYKKDGEKRKAAKTISLKGRYPLGGGRDRFAYVSEFFSERFHKTYINVDIREYDIDDLDDANNRGRATLKGVALNPKEFEELCRIIPKLRKDLQAKRTALLEARATAEVQTATKTDSE